MVILKKYFFVFGCFLFFIGGILTSLVFHFFTHQNSSISYIRNSENTVYTNPLLECEPSSKTTDSKYASLKNKTSQLIVDLISQKKTGFVSVYYRDLNNGPWVGINENEFFVPASLSKLPLLISLYKMKEEKSDLFSTVLTTPPTTTSDLKQNILPREQLKPDTKYEIKELMRFMIVYSDNNAYDLLSTFVDNNILIKTYTNLGIDLEPVFKDPNASFMTTHDYGRFFRILYNASYLSRNSSEEILALLSKAEFSEGIRAGVPPKIAIAHKFGERQDPLVEKDHFQLHDCGVVYYPKKPYVLCVMTRGEDFSGLKETISQISKIVYEEVNNQ